MQLSRLVAALDRLTPPTQAEAWDNVGLLVGQARTQVARALLCIDLTEAVAAEAIAADCRLIIAYHPPIFAPLKRLTQAHWQQRLLLQLIGRKIAVYSPHTALDNIHGGVADWLCDAIGPAKLRRAIIEEKQTARVQRLSRAITAATLIRKTKQHLGLASVKVAFPTAAPNAARTARIASSLRVSSVAVCPGSGASVFAACSEADAYLTGELRHHEVLDLAQRGKLVVLTGHTQSERPYLSRYRELLHQHVSRDIRWMISKADRSAMIVL